MKNWNILNKFNTHKSNQELLDLLLKNRGIETQKDREDFLHPKLEEVTANNVGITRQQLDKALKRIRKAITNKEQIIIYGDYDVDGITATAILWETLHAMDAKVMPYIPNRIDEGYGLSEKGIINLNAKFSEVKLIITVDNGIVATQAVAFAKKQNIDVIITDHHAVGEKPPKAYAIVHTTKLCGAGIAYLLSKELQKPHSLRDDVHLELAALGTIADLVPLTDANRAIVKFGLEKLSRTERTGLQELYKMAGVSVSENSIGVYEVGYIISPRLNAAGRIEDAMDSLRLLCTKNQKRAEQLALKLEQINRERQTLTKEATEHALTGIRNQESGIRKLLFIGHETYKEGVIGLIAGKLVETFYRPAIVLAIGQTRSKGSARSISGFNMIEFLRTQQEHFIGLGGHPMAAGFTIETAKMPILQKLFEEAAEVLIAEETLQRTLRIDCELPLEIITQELYQTLQKLSPFGMANPEPIFVSRNVIIKEMKILGKDKKHLKLTVTNAKLPMLNKKNELDTSHVSSIEAIAFGMADLADNVKPGDAIDLAYTIDENVWNDTVRLQLKVKDVKWKSTKN